MSAQGESGVERRDLALRSYWDFYEPIAEEVAAELHDIMARIPVLAEIVQALPPEAVRSQTRHEIEIQRQAIVDGQWDAYIAEARKLGKEYARLGVGFSAWLDVLAGFRDRIGVRLLPLAREDLPRAELVSEGLSHFLGVAMGALAEAYLRAKEERTAQLAAAKRSLEDSEQLLRSVLDSIPDGVAVTDARGRIVMINPAGERLLGAGVVLVGTGGEELRVLQGDGVTPLSRADHPLARALAGDELAEAEVYVERRNASTGVHLHVSAAPFRGGGAVIGAVVVFRDVSARRAAEEAARQAEERLARAQKLDALGQLAGGITHDFNNIISVIAGYASLLLDELPKDDPLAEDVEEIARAARSAASLTRQLLAFSRVQVLKPQVLALNAIVEETASMLRRTIGADIHLATALAAGLGSVLADRGQVEQILMNLAVNARDAMPGGGRLTIETRNVDVDTSERPPQAALPPGRWVLLAVTDTGSGMDTATLARIFEPFFTTKAPGRGTGLGLATVYGIVQQSGGEILAYSEIGVGTSIRIYLPRVEGPAEHDSPEELSRPGTERGTILLVEDSDAVRQVAARILRGGGYLVLEAESGEEARALSAGHPGGIDLLLTDVVLPGGTMGHDLADELLRERPEMQVLYVSGYAMAGITHAGALSVAVPFIEKPFTADVLRHGVRQALHRSQTAAPATRSVVPPGRR